MNRRARMSLIALALLFAVGTSACTNLTGPRGDDENVQGSGT